MICLTGDVHHQSCHTREASLIAPRTEIQLAREYVEIAQAYGLKVTLFTTGRTFEEEWEDAQDLIGYKNLEIGGHTYNAFTPLWLHRGFKLIRGSYWGPSFLQRREIRQTMGVIHARTGISIVSWRNHSLEYDRNTPRLLGDCGIRVWSNILDRRCTYPYWISDHLLALPINVTSDHSAVYHGFVTKEWVEQNRAKWITGLKRLLQSTRAPEPEYYSREKWMARVQQEVRDKVELGGLAVLNLHPVCMYLLDQFRTFEILCAFFARFPSIWAKDALELARTQYKGSHLGL